jgi:rRNA maturation RNase YbeY
MSKNMLSKSSIKYSTQDDCVNQILFFKSSAKAPSFNRTKFRQGIIALAAAKKKTIGNISYVFCTDEELLTINKNYLQHDTYTDIITFDYSEQLNSSALFGSQTSTFELFEKPRTKKTDKKNIISGDVFISVERIRENSCKFGVTFKQELLRVMVHGILHLLGLKDKTPAESRRMRMAEESAIKEYFAGFY